MLRSGLACYAALSGFLRRLGFGAARRYFLGCLPWRCPVWARPGDRRLLGLLSVVSREFAAVMAALQQGQRVGAGTSGVRLVGALGRDETFVSTGNPTFAGQQRLTVFCVLRPHPV